MQSSGRQRDRLRLALLIDALDGAYQDAVLRGAADAARDRGVDLLCFAGGVLQSRDPSSRQRNVLFDLLGPDLVDGLVVAAGTLGNAIGSGGVARFVERWHPLPMVGLGVPLPNTTCVLVDNEDGMRQAVAHLVRDCERRRIAFVRGPVTNREAERRYAAYADSLVHHDLRLDERLIVQASFDRAAGGAAVATLFDERKASPDAIMAASDTLALGCIDALLLRGIRIPEDVAVVGFDDIAEARSAQVPLTTVRQPLHDEGRRAVDALLELIEGRAPPRRIVLATELVRRRSSGRWRRHGAARRPATSRQPEASIDDRTSVAALLAPVMPTPSRATDAAVALVDAFIDELHGRPGAGVQATLRRVVAPTLPQVDGDRWQEVISVLRREMLRRLGDAPGIRARAESLLHAARVELSELIEQAQSRRRLRADAWARSLGRSTGALVASFDLGALGPVVAQQFPRIEIASCFLAEFTDDSRSHARLLITFDEANDEGRPEESFPSQSLLPEGAWPCGPRVHVVEPLIFGGTPLGYALLEYGPAEGVVYEALRDQLGAALQGARLVRSIVEKDRERDRLLRDLEERAHQLERAYAALRDGQRRLLVSETMASLGQMTARARPLAQLVEEVLDQLRELLGDVVAFVAMLPAEMAHDPPCTSPGHHRATVDAEDVLVGTSDEPRLVRVAARGSAVLPSEPVRQLLEDVLTDEAPRRRGDDVAVPLCAGGRLLGVLVLSRRGWTDHDLELVNTFAAQATMAIQNGQLYRMAALDPLTDVHARRFFDRWLPHEVQSARTSRSPLSLLMIDMDDMKRINDSGGHLAGDRALLNMGRVLRRATRDADVIARFGGDEFAVLLPDTDAGGAAVVGRRILELCRGVELPEVGPLRCSIGASTLIVGPVAEARGASVVERVAQQLVSNADGALYHAKRAGGDRLGDAIATPWPTA